ncbi:GNAT family N-acetyltransferase [Nocardioides albus]|uniref:GNAT family N-acetyltransferase n=1 Tax=Nocardioides albus TaxID=1841 RepID=UPI00198912FB|nr:hypothetical protein GCM10007979_29490 [Nocardioides albus]
MSRSSPQPAACSPGTVIPRYVTQADTRMCGWLDGTALVVAAGLMVSDRSVEIGHIATRHDRRRQGYAARLIRSVASEVAPLPLFAETDDDAVDFYRRVGFTVTVVDSPWPTNRYRCVLESDTQPRAQPPY